LKKNFKTIYKKTFWAKTMLINHNKNTNKSLTMKTRLTVIEFFFVYHFIKL